MQGWKSVLGACTFGGSEERSGTTKYDEKIRISLPFSHGTNHCERLQWHCAFSLKKGFTFLTSWQRTPPKIFFFTFLCQIHIVTAYRLLNTQFTLLAPTNTASLLLCLGPLFIIPKIEFSDAGNVSWIFSGNIREFLRRNESAPDDWMDCARHHGGGSSRYCTAFSRSTLNQQKQKQSMERNPLRH